MPDVADGEDLLCFGNFVLDAARGCLQDADGYEIPLRPKSFDVLQLFIRKAGRLLTKDSVLEAIWPNVHVTEDNLVQCVRDIRRALRDESGRIMRTVARKGYIFDLEIRRKGRFVDIGEACPAKLVGPGVPPAKDQGEVSPLPSAAALPRAERRQVTIGHRSSALNELIAEPVAGSPSPEKLSIAVMPFQNMSADPEQEYFADGVVEEVITSLSRIPWLLVVARSSSFTYKGQTVSLKQVGRELGVRYILEGSVRKAGGRVRISARLIDATNGTHLWADRFDGSLEDVFDLQDKVAVSVAGVIEPALQAAETARSATRPTNDLTAYDLYLRGYALFWTSAKQVPEALQLFEQAIRCDSYYGPALAWAAVCFHRIAIVGTSKDPDGDRRAAIEHARRALQVAGEDPVVLSNAAFALGFFGEDIDAMIALVDRALAFNPSYARAWHLSGNLRVYAGKNNTAIEHLETALRLSPRARVGSSLSLIGQAHFFSRRFDEAVPRLHLAAQEDPSHPAGLRCLVACYAQMGQRAAAREILGRLQAITPAVVPNADYLRNPDQRELLLSGLRMALDEAE